jgi:hypothetical protein
MDWKPLLTGILFLLDALLGYGGSNSSFYYAPGIMFLAGGFVGKELFNGKIISFVTWICLIISIIMFVSGIMGINLFS